MTVADFKREHMEQAALLARAAYEEERGRVPALPRVDVMPTLDEFADNGLGVALLEGGALLGFLCCYGPIERFFGLSAGAFAPVHAHCAVKERRSHIYDRLYQAASEKWVRAGILSHAVQLYAHDERAIRAFFENGFGSRCVDAVRVTVPVDAPQTGLTFREVDEGAVAALTDMKRALNAHFRGAPMFMASEDDDIAGDIRAWMAEDNHHWFAAQDGDKLVAQIRVQPGGENFAADAPTMLNITSAYALPEYRGGGVYTALLAYLMDWLRGRGYAQCGVDFESFNYTARRFWLKHFTAYTCSVCRRIDERIVK